MPRDAQAFPVEIQTAPSDDTGPSREGQRLVRGVTAHREHVLIGVTTFQENATTPVRITSAFMEVDRDGDGTVDTGVDISETGKATHLEGKPLHVATAAAMNLVKYIGDITNAPSVTDQQLQQALNQFRNAHAIER